MQLSGSRATPGNTAYGPAGSETVYLLSAGASTAQAIYRERVDFAVCERQPELAWHGAWLLYSASEGYAAAIDTSQPGRAAPVDQPAQQDRRRAGHPHSRRPLRHQKKPSLSGE
jgi:hypothetical protein